MPPAGPGPIAPVHRITIVTALLGALAYLAWEVNQLVTTSEPWAGVRAVLALVATVGIAVYLRSLRGLAAKLTPRTRPPGALVLAALVLAAPARAEVVWRRDQRGVTHLSNPRPGGATTRPSPSHDSALCARRPSRYPPVELFSTNWCPHCGSAQRFFQEHGVPFAYLDIEKDDEAATRYRLLARDRPDLPLVVIGDAVVSGFRPEAYRSALCPRT